MNIGVVIPSFNDRPFLERLFESLYSTSAGATFYPVIVDDQSDDGTEDWVKTALQGYAVVLRPTTKAYFTRSVNLGLDWLKKNTGPQFYFLLNSDTVVTDGWGLALIATARKMEAGIVGATLLYPDGRVQHAGGYGPGQHFGINEPWLKRHEDHYVPWVTGGAMCIHSETLDTVGFLPTDKLAQYDHSDRDYCTKAAIQNGVKIAVSAGCVIYHFTHEAEAVRKARGDY